METNAGRITSSRAHEDQHLSKADFLGVSNSAAERFQLLDTVLFLISFHMEGMIAMKCLKPRIIMRTQANSELIDVKVTCQQLLFMFKGIISHLP